MMPASDLPAQAAVSFMKWLQTQTNSQLEKLSIFYNDESLGRSFMNSMLAQLQQISGADFPSLKIRYFNLIWPDTLDPSLWSESLVKAKVFNANINVLAIQAAGVDTVLQAISDEGLVGPNKEWFDCL